MNKELLNIYSDYLISQNGYATATGLSALLNGEISHDQVSRFLRAEDYGSKELWNYVKPEIRRHEQATGGVLLLDDTQKKIIPMAFEIYLPMSFRRLLHND